jgi:hypothetical protein
LDCLKQLFEAIIGHGKSQSSMETNNEQLIINQLLAHSQRHRVLLAETHVQVVEQAQSIQKLSAQVGEQTQLNQKLSVQAQTLEAQIAEITGSKTWKIALVFRRGRVWLAPPKSRRARMLRRLANIISVPFKKMSDLRNRRRLPL